MAYSQAHRLPLPSDATSSSRREANLAFVVDQAKLNPTFEAYKLIQDDSSSSSTSKSYGLPSLPPRLVDLYQAQGKDGREGNLTFIGLGYRETKERALHQVLVPASGERSVDEPFAAYIDPNRFVFVLTYDAEKDRVVGHVVLRLGRGENSVGNGFSEPLPSLASISSTEWVASSGGTVVLIRLQKVKPGYGGAMTWTSAIEAKWMIPLDEKVSSGGTIKACKKVGGKVRVLVQSTKAVTVLHPGKGKEGMQGLGFQRSTRQHAQASKEGQTGHGQTVFQVQLIEIDDIEPKFPEQTRDELEANTIKKATLVWSVQGEEPLIMAKLGDKESLLGAEAPFCNIENTSGKESQPQRGGSSLSTPSIARSRGRRKAPHFSWAQTGDTVTIAFTLPPWIMKSHIRAHFSLIALSLSLTQDALDLLEIPSSAGKIIEIYTDAANAAGQDDDDLAHAAKMIASGRYISRSTWAEIDPTGSVWTLESVRGMSLLTLHLEKRHEGTRWIQVFADRIGTRRSSRNRNYLGADTGDKSGMHLSFRQARSEFERIATGNPLEINDDEDAEEEDAEDNEDDVPETMDPSELISMLEGMQKYTVDEESAQQGDNYGLNRSGFDSSNGHGQNGGTSLSLDQPSLLKDSLEEEDANVGRNFAVCSISHSSDDSVQIRSTNCGGMTVLATGLAGSDREGEAAVIKHDLDGAIFISPEKDWKHVATMPALAFVLASKRDAQRVHIHKRNGAHAHEGEFVVLAFESAPQVTGSSGSGGGNAAAGAGNLFLYYSPWSANAKYASSRVVRLGATGNAYMVDNAGQTEVKEGIASGALLGVCSARLPRAGAPRDGSEMELEETLVCLCEKRILLLRGLL